jgi:hypothetical protein
LAANPIVRWSAVAGILLVLALIAVGVGVSVQDGGSDAADEPEQRTESGIMCEPELAAEGAEDESAREAPAAQTPVQTGLFFQNDARWASAEYDHSTGLPAGADWCGTSIAQCGCATTSVTNVLSLFEVLTTPEGRQLDPMSLNGWLARDAQRTESGFISKGYFLGDVIWTDVQALSARLRGRDPEAPSIRFRGVGSGALRELRDELGAGRPVVLEVPGHFIAAVAIEGDDVVVHDPFYPDRTRLSEYPARVVSSRLFEIADDLSSIVVMSPAGVRFEVIDPDGNVTGSLHDSPLEELASGARTGIPDSAYYFEAAWRDPTCTERPPPPGAGNVSALISHPQPGTYTVRAVHPPGSETCIAVYRYRSDGSVDVQIQCATGESRLEFDYDPGLTPIAGSEPPPIESDTATAVAAPTDIATVTAPPTVAPRDADTPTPPPTPVASTPPPTPAAEQSPTPSPAPTLGDLGCSPNPVGVGQLVTCDPVVSGEVSSFAWTSAGQPGAGGQQRFSTSFNQPGNQPIELRACNDESCTTGSTTISVLTTPDASFVCLPGSVSLGETVQCQAAASGALTFQWSLDGVASGIAPTFATAFAEAGVRTIELRVCNEIECASGLTTITVTQPIAATVQCAPAAVSTGDLVTCSASIVAGGPAVSYAWTATDSGGAIPNDANPDSGSAPTFSTRFSNPGTKIVALQVCNASSCTSPSASVAVAAVITPPVIESFSSLLGSFSGNPTGAGCSVSIDLQWHVATTPGATVSVTRTIVSDPPDVALGSVPQSTGTTQFLTDAFIDLPPEARSYVYTLEVANSAGVSQATTAPINVLCDVLPLIQTFTATLTGAPAVGPTCQVAIEVNWFISANPGASPLVQLARSSSDSPFIVIILGISQAVDAPVTFMDSFPQSAGSVSYTYTLSITDLNGSDQAFSNSVSVLCGPL